MTDPQSTRRELLTSLHAAVRTVTNADEPAEVHSQQEGPGHRRPDPACFTGGSTVRVATRAMACEFSAILNPGQPQEIALAGEAMREVHEIESWLSIYRDGSEISHVNSNAGAGPVAVRREFLELLLQAQLLHGWTEGAFDIAAGAMVQLWQSQRRLDAIPAADQIFCMLEYCGSQHLQLDTESSTVQFARPGLRLDPGAIGKGFALDAAARQMRNISEPLTDFLLHGGHSSLVAQGTHLHLDGWPVGIGNPLFTRQRLGVVLLRDQAMSTSGSNIQYFRCQGQRYGHILDPRTGWPATGMLSVTVLAPSAAVADALSTAFFVLGVEKACQCCEQIGNIGVILIPFPEQGRRVCPVVTGILPDRILWDPDQVAQP